MNTIKQKTIAVAKKTRAQLTVINEILFSCEAIRVRVRAKLFSCFLQAREDYPCKGLMMASEGFIGELAHQGNFCLAASRIRQQTLLLIAVFIVFVFPSQPNNTLTYLTTMKNSSQIILAIALVAFGVLLITAAFAVPPTGVIDPSVLTAFGEILTFCGSVIGIDYHYKAKRPS